MWRRVFFVLLFALPLSERVVRILSNFECFHLSHPLIAHFSAPTSAFFSWMNQKRRKLLWWSRLIGQFLTLGGDNDDVPIWSVSKKYFHGTLRDFYRSCGCFEDTCVIYERCQAIRIWFQFFFSVVLIKHSWACHDFYWCCCFGMLWLYFSVRSLLFDWLSAILET